MFGTYELLNCSALNGQVGRRSEGIHLALYDTWKPEDIAELRVISTIQRYLPLEEEPDLEKH